MISNIIVLIISFIFILSFRVIPVIIGIVGASASIIAIVKARKQSKDDDNDPDNINW